jgi:hypothetical protein
MSLTFFSQVLVGVVYVIEEGRTTGYAKFEFLILLRPFRVFDTLVLSAN